MPTYDYVCDACGHAFELFQGMSDPVKRSCPECKARKLRRLIGTGAAILVGGRSSDPGPAETASNSDDSSSAESDSTGEGGGSDNTTEKKTGEDKTERTMSGSTSTPTHEAREHRGIGNLVDAARRTRQADAGSKGGKTDSSKKTSDGGKPKSKPRSESSSKSPAKKAAKPKPRQAGTSPKRKSKKGG